MTIREEKAFDCVKSVREIRDRISVKMVRMSPEERMEWLSTREFSDPTLRRLAARYQQRRDHATVPGVSADCD